MNPVQVQIHRDWVKKIKQDTFKDQVAVEKCISLLNESKDGKAKCQDCSTRCRTHLKMLGFTVTAANSSNRSYEVSKMISSDR